MNSTYLSLNCNTLHYRQETETCGYDMVCLRFLKDIFCDSYDPSPIFLTVMVCKLYAIILWAFVLSLLLLIYIVYYKLHVLQNWGNRSSMQGAAPPPEAPSHVRFAEIWHMLMLMLICCERKTLFVCWKVLLMIEIDNENIWSGLYLGILHNFHIYFCK